MKAMSTVNTLSVKYLVLYIIRTGPMYISEHSGKELSEGGSGNTMKKTKNETNDIRRPYMVARE